MAERAHPRPWVASTQQQVQRSLMARHRIFCEGLGGEVLEVCQAASPGSFHDEYDAEALQFGVTYGRRVIATARLILGTDPWSLPTGRILGRLEVAPQLAEGVKYSEPSRLGMLAAYQTRTVGTVAMLGLIGQIADVSVGCGYENYLLTLRGDLVRALSWFPWVLSPPFDYPASEGGPIKREPMWLATLNLHELVVEVNRRTEFVRRAMFPIQPAWLDTSQVAPRGELALRAKHNRNLVREVYARWNSGDQQLATLRSFAG
jgi:hypothetical protein